MQKKVTYGGMGTALCVLLLVMSSYLPAGKAASLFLASALCYTMCYVADCKIACIMYVAATLISLIFMPGVAVTAVFAICFGNYPVIKAYIDTRSVKLRVLFKLVLYTVYFLSVYLVFKFLLNITIPYALILLYVIGVPVFAFYDWLLVSTGRYIMHLLRK